MPSPTTESSPDPDPGSEGLGNTNRAEDVLLNCFQLPPDEWQEAIERACVQHPDLADELRRRAKRLQETGMLDSAPASFEHVPERLGEFKLLRQLSSGGMGVVYVALQENMNREVALKLVRPEQLYFPRAKERFHREVDAISRLKHPGIVPVYAFGEDQDIPYLAMEYIEGCTLAQALHRVAQGRPERLSGDDLLAVLEKIGTLTPSARGLCAGSWSDVCVRIATHVAEALEHAHARGVVHRDVKPSNIMLGPDGRVVLLDFGVARAEGASALTRPGSQPGSLPYMAPEQVRGVPSNEQTDVYGLGVTLYEMLALTAPYWDESTESLIRKILAAQPTPLRQRNHAVGTDLSTVCHVAMDPSAAHRYPSMAALAADLRRITAKQPILARPIGPLLRMRRLCQRRPALAVTVGAAVMMVVGVPVAINISVAGERDRAIRSGYAAQVIAADYALKSHNTVAARQRLERCPEELRGFEWRFLSLKVDQSRLHLPEHKGWLNSIFFVGDGSQVVLFTPERTLHGLRTRDGMQMWQQSVPGAHRVARSPDGKTLAIGGRFGGKLATRLLDAITGVPQVTIPVASANITFSGDGKVIVLHRGTQSVVVDAHNHEKRHTVDKLPPALRAVSHDGSLAAFENPQVCVEIRRLQDGGLVQRLEGVSPLTAAFSSDGRSLACGTRNGWVKVFAVKDGRLLHSIRAHQDRTVNAVQFGPGGMIFSSGNDSTICVSDPDTGRVKKSLLGHESSVLAFDVDARGRELVSVSPYHGLRLWSLDRPPHRTTLLGHKKAVTDLQWSPDGDRLYTTSEDGTVGVWDSRKGVELKRLRIGQRATHSALSPDGGLLATAFVHHEQSVVLWDLIGDTEITRLDGRGFESKNLAFSPDGKHLVVGGIDGSLRVWNVERPADLDKHRQMPQVIKTAHKGPVWAARFSPDGKTIWSGARGSDRILVHDARDRVRLRTIDVGGQVLDLAFTGNGERLLSAEDDLVVLRDLLGAEQMKLVGHRLRVHEVDVSPDGSRFATASADGTVRIWHAGTGEDLLVLEAGGDYVYAVAFSPDGNRLATGSENGVVTIWETVARR